MIEFLLGMVRNEVLMSAILSWMLAQIIKTIIHLFETRKFVPERLIGSGGMPSCHSAAMCALTTSILINEGISSTYLAIAAVMSVVVMYDAMGVRRETGIHSAVLNEIISDYREAGKELTPVEKMREFMGHTPLQVLVGALLGIASALLYCLVIIR